MTEPTQREQAIAALINYAANVSEEDVSDFMREQHIEYLNQFSDEELKIALSQIGLGHIMRDSNA